jgi:hypothetical protein
MSDVNLEEGSTVLNYPGGELKLPVKAASEGSAGIEVT